MLLAPVQALASCAPGAQLSYDDITYVKLVEYSLVGMARPAFTFTVLRYLYKSVPPKTYASLEQTRPSKGTLSAVTPDAALSAAVNVLSRHQFFAMRLTPTPNLHLDGAEDSITVGRCGVLTTITTVPNGDEIDLDDGQARAFFALEADLRTAIFAQQWEFKH